MKKKRLHNALSIILNVSIILFTIYAISYYFTSGNVSDALNVDRTTCFRYFTNLSNIFVALTSIVVLVFNIRCTVKDKYFMPEWIMALKFSATVSVTVTFITVVVFLAPAFASKGSGYFYLFKGSMFFLHFFTPLLAIISVIFFERARDFKFRYCLFGILPTVVYSILYFYEVVIVGVKNGGWPDFYGFTFGGNLKMIPASVIVMYAATFGFCALLWKLNQIKSKKIIERKSK